MVNPNREDERKKKKTRKNPTHPQIHRRETGVSPMPRNPYAPPVKEVRKFIKKFLTISPNAKVTMARKMPLILRAGNPTRKPMIPAMIPPARRARKRGRCKWTVRIAET